MGLTVNAVGDVAPRRAVPASIFAHVQPFLADTDLRFGQMECPISSRGSPSPNAKLAMRTEPAVAGVLRDAGFDLMSIAGNHAMDFGAVALGDTIDLLGRAGIAVTGAGLTIAQARRPAIITAAGKRVALLAYCSILPSGYVAEPARAGCAPIRAYTHFHHIEPDQPGTPPRVLTFAEPQDVAAMEADIAAARDQADIVLVSFHWGIHFVRATLADYQAVVARAAIDAGADAVLGHHPHLLKAIDYHRGKPILYSLGNFAIEQPSAFRADIKLDQSFEELTKLNQGFNPEHRYMSPPETRHTMIARLEFSDAGDVTTSLRLCRINDDSVPIPVAPGEADFDEALDYLVAVTREAGIDTEFRIERDQVVVYDDKRHIIS